MTRRLEICVAVSKYITSQECEAVIKALTPVMQLHGGEITFIARHDFSPGTSCISFAGPDVQLSLTETE